VVIADESKPLPVLSIGAACLELGNKLLNSRKGLVGIFVLGILSRNLDFVDFAVLELRQIVTEVCEWLHPRT
jgi:hypothetical protein